MFSAANGNAITVSDIDAGVAALQVTLTVTNGTLTVTAGGGATEASSVRGAGMGNGASAIEAPSYRAHPRLYQAV